MDLKRTRWVRRLDDGTYTIEPESKLNNQKELCDLCGIQSKCPINAVRHKFRATGADFHLNSCLRYVPLIAFRKPIIGLNEPYFNTLRTGITWVNRVSPGKIVCLVDSANGERIRFARVDRVCSGDLDNMLRRHSRFNHLCMGGESVEKVEEVIRKSYGHFLKPESQLTAIYLRSVDREHDVEYHTHNELELEDPRAKAEVIDMTTLRRKHESAL